MAVMRDGGGGMASTAASTAVIDGALGALMGATGPGLLLHMNASTINLLRGDLMRVRDSLVAARGELETVAPSAVGGSPIGAALVQHSQMADERLRETIAAVNKGLERYDAALAVSLSSVETADEQAAADALAGESVIAEATGPSGQG